jgi:NADPH2:quinone reductase
MKAAWYEKNGTARDVLQHGERPMPEQIGPNDVRVKLHTSGINPSDVKRRAGANNRPMEFPIVIPHMDGAGVVHAVGREVNPARIGQRVWVFAAQIGRPFGTAAEYVVLPAPQAVPLPSNTSFEEGACLGVPALTAHRLVFADGAVRGQTILVAGGTGSVGHYAVQMAALAGARVITTVGSSKKVDAAHSAGAELVLNYREDDLAARILDATSGRGVNRVIEVDFAANLSVDLKVLQSNGVLAVYGSPSDATPAFPYYAVARQAITIRTTSVYLLPQPALEEGIAHITGLLEGRSLQHIIGARFELRDIIAAHEAVEQSRFVGNVVISIQ